MAAQSIAALLILLIGVHASVSGFVFSEIDALDGNNPWHPLSMLSGWITITALVVSITACPSLVAIALIESFNMERPQADLKFGGGFGVFFGLVVGFYLSLVFSNALVVTPLVSAIVGASVSFLYWRLAGNPSQRGDPHA